MDNVLFELLVKYPITTADKIEEKRFGNSTFAQRKINLYNYSKPSEHSVRGNCRKIGDTCTNRKTNFVTVAQKELIEKQGNGRNVSYTIK